MAAEDRAVAALEQLVAAVGLSQEVTAGLIEANRETNARIGELSEDIAGLALRVSELERQARNEHSLTVAGRERFRTLDELAAVLRAEFTAEVADLAERVDTVHTQALRALTYKTGRTHTA